MTRPAGGRRARPIAAAALVLTLGVVGCGGASKTHDLGTHSGVGFLKGMLVSDRPVVAFPGLRWGGNSEGGKWTFKGSARIYCVVNRVPEGDLSFHFTPDETTADLWFTARWDDTPLFEEPQMPAYGNNVVTIPADLVVPGLHILTVERADSLTPPDLASITANMFPGLGYGSGEATWMFDLARIWQYRYMAMLLTRGVTGLTPQKMAGCLFDGPQTAVVDLEVASGGVVSFRVENSSQEPALFTLALGERSASAEVDSGSGGRLELEAHPGRQPLTLRVQGDAAGSFLWGAPHIGRAPEADRPPVLIVTLDTTRRDALSPWGAPAAASPHLQAVADRATVFDNAWTVSPWTLPSHASIFTGLYPHHHGAGVVDDHLPARFETLAEALSAAGYFAAGFAGGVMSSGSFGVGQGFDLFLDPEGFETPGDRLVDAVEEFLASDPPDPLLLFVNFFDPHGIYAAPAEYQALFDVDGLAEPIRQLPVWLGLVQGRGQAFGRLIVGEAETTPEALAYLRASYLAEVAFMDAQIGRLLDLFGDRGLYEPAMIVFAADHGELLGESGFFGHCCRLDPELVEMPLIIKWPHQVEPRRIGELVSQVDLYPTVLAAAGIEAPAGDGVLIDPNDLSTLQARRDVFMEEHDESRIHPLYEHMMLARHVYGIQQTDWREVVWNGGMECQEDSASGWREAPCNLGWADRLSWVRGLVNLAVDEAASGSEDMVTDDDRVRLKALGYVQ